jgi:hypothetical protein
MQGIYAAPGGISFDKDRDSRKLLLQIVLGGVALSAIGAGGAILRGGPAPISGFVPARSAAPAPAAAAAKTDANAFGAMIIEPEWRSEQASLERGPSPQPSLEAVTPAPAETTPQVSLEAAQPENIPLPQLENVPLPPVRDVARVDETAPLPPPRPPEFGSLPPSAAPERRLPQPSIGPAPAPADNRNLFQKLFGLGLPSGPSSAPGLTIASRPTATSAPAAPVVASRPTSAPAPAAAPASAVASAAPEGRIFGRGLFAPSAPSGYDHWTAVYDISARTVYLPDGTRLEAHSGLGDRLDDPRYVAERARGATPPHLYELTLREGSFHGVQALRLNPIGEGGIYGRAGLLAHSYMLGPNGDSNGCVSFKDYNAFLRAYQNGQIKRLAVVARM